jgi:TM2 domain-containing membrane protein YozV
VGQPQGVVNSHKSPILGAILSFLIIGLGQVYLGLTKKGIILFVLAIVSGFLMLLFVGYILWLLVWLYAIYDGYNSANKMNNGIAVEDTLDFNNLF